MNGKATIPGSSSGRRAALNRLGIVVLLLGIGIASIIYWSGQHRSARQSNDQGTTNADGDWKDGTIPFEDTKRFSRDVEMNYGKVGVLVVRCQLWWQELEPSQRLAMIIATVSTFAAFGCFLVANRLL